MHSWQRLVEMKTTDMAGAAFYRLRVWPGDTPVLLTAVRLRA